MRVIREMARGKDERAGLRDRFFIVTWKRVITHDAIRNERGAGSKTWPTARKNGAVPLPLP